MRFLTHVGGAMALALLLASGARADVTAAQVWQGMVDLSAASGGSLSASAQRLEGDTLILSGVGAKTAADPLGLRLSLPELRLRDMGDGRVEIIPAGKATGSLALSDGSGATGRTNLDIAQKGLRVIVSGTPDDMRFDAEAAEVKVATVEPAAAPFSVTLAQGKGEVRVAGRTTRTMDADLAFATIGFDLSKAGDKDKAGAFHGAGTLNGVKLTSGLQLPPDLDTSDMSVALKAGYRMESRLRFATGNVSADMKEAEGTTNVQAGLADGELTASIGKDGVGYALATGASRAVVQLPALPVPAEVGFSELRVSASMPVEPGDAAQPFATGLKLDGLTFSEGLWGIFDPSAVLPRDPMTLALDLGGKVRLTGGFFDAATAEDGATLPAEVEALSLNELKLSAVGAEITGKGAATVTTGGTQPIPVGAADFEMKGLNGLIDKLVGMTLLPQEQAMGLRMSLALFTVPTGDDSAKSRVEADAEGNVRVNGQVLYKFPKP